MTTPTLSPTIRRAAFLAGDAVSLACLLVIGAAILLGLGAI